MKTWKLIFRSLVMMSVMAAVVGLGGCFGVGPGGGGATSTDRKIAGTYKSSQEKSIVFELSGSYQIFVNPKNLEDKNPDQSGTYTVVGKEILFKSSSGEDIPEKGALVEGDGSFTWERFPGETFQKLQ